MRVSELRDLTKEELKSRLSELKKEIFSLKFQKAIGQLENPMRIKNLKRDIARINTLLREKEIGIEEERKQKIGSRKKA
ncbi:MAG: 50S ribosomal protein L29 [Actinobacteria bacterium]|nr:50S ribosomal protein L29 [Actinomycetota bacterium]